MEREYKILMGSDGELSFIELDIDDDLYTRLDVVRSQGYSQVIINNKNMLDLINYFVVGNAYNLMDIDIGYSLKEVCKRLMSPYAYKCTTTEYNLVKLAYFNSNEDFILSFLVGRVGGYLRINVEGTVECVGGEICESLVKDILRIIANGY